MLFYNVAPGKPTMFQWQATHIRVFVQYTLSLIRVKKDPVLDGKGRVMDLGRVGGGENMINACIKFLKS